MVNPLRGPAIPAHAFFPWLRARCPNTHQAKAMTLTNFGIFLTGRAAGESLQRELVRGVWGAKCIDDKGLSREIREKAKGLLWA